MCNNWRFVRTILFTTAVSLPAWPAWTPGLAAKYLDQREQQWFEWPVAKRPGGVCVSCHTNMTYLLARPMLRKVLGEPEPTQYEKGLLDGLRTRLANDESMFPTLKKEPLRSQARNVETALAVVLLNAQDAIPAWERVPAFDALTWGFKLNLDPWELDSSGYFGASLITLGAGKRVSPDLRDLRAYLNREFPNQPLHQKLMALWSGALDGNLVGSLAEEVWKQQAADGGWTDEALGPWAERPAKPESRGSSAYATAFVTFAIQQGGIGCADPRLARAKAWLEANQNPETGAWSAVSMNKQYPPGSMQAGFMSDAATGFAVMALLDHGHCDAILKR